MCWSKQDHCPDGTKFIGSLNTALVLAANAGNVIDLAPYFRLFPEGPEAMQNAADWGLHQFGTWMAKRDGNSTLMIWDPWGMNFQSFVSVAVYHEIDIRTIGDPVFLAKRQYAEDQLHLLPGWSATLDRSGRHDIYSPVGDFFVSLEKAGVTAGVIRPNNVVRRELNDFRKIVREIHPRVTNRVMSATSFLRLANVEYTASSTLSNKFLGGERGLIYENLYRASTFANNADALEQAARDAGVTDIDEYRRRMREALAQRIQDGVYRYEEAAAFEARDDNEEAFGAAAVARVDEAIALPPIDANGVGDAVLPAIDDDVAAVDADGVVQMEEV